MMDNILSYKVEKLQINVNFMHGKFKISQEIGFKRGWSTCLVLDL